MAELKITNLCKKYEDTFEAVRDFNLEARDGEFIVIVGPSGCGKSTTLRMIAGLEQPSAGSILLDGMAVNHLPPQKRDMAMIFQNYALYENMTAFENIAFPLKVRGLKKTEIASKVTAAAEILKISELLNRKPGALSGGEKQRVAMGRAIVREPKLFLMDEPLSNLDAKMRFALRKEIRQLQRRTGVTTIYVTHDQGEAMALADRVIVMDHGNIRQIGTPREIYSSPSDPFVAAFFGSLPMNLWEENHMICGIRPEDISLSKSFAHGWEKALLLTGYFNGVQWIGEVQCEAGRFTVCSDCEMEQQQAVYLHFAEDKIHRWQKG